MKRLVAVFCLGAWLTCAFAQGLIDFVNTPTTLVSQGPAGPIGLGGNLPDSFYFALLTSPVGARSFTFAGIYGTNTIGVGRFSGGFGVAVDGWLAGTARDFEVVGWSASEGAPFNPAWLSGNIMSFRDPFGFFGVSSIGTGLAGGFPGSGQVPLPPLLIFGRGTGIQTGFNLLPVASVPEPCAAGLAGFGAAVLMIFRSRRWANQADQSVYE